MLDLRLMFVLLIALSMAGCGRGDDVAQRDPVQKGGAAASASKTARDVARQATGAAPQIVNPAEELVEFDPAGILRWSAVAGADAYEVWAYNDAGLSNLAEFSKALVSRRYQFTQLSGGKTYWIKLYFRANGVWQEAPTFTVQTTVNVTKSRLTNSQEELEAIGPSATLRWTAVAGASDRTSSPISPEPQVAVLLLTSVDLLWTGIPHLT